jgi:hypothetical protein
LAEAHDFFMTIKDTASFTLKMHFSTVTCQVRDREEVAAHVWSVQDVLEDYSLAISVGVHTNEYASLPNGQDRTVVTEDYFNGLRERRVISEPMPM